jgi:hypothetical protein
MVYAAKDQRNHRPHRNLARPGARQAVNAGCATSRRYQASKIL